jgi:hypothetical protein
MTALETWTLWLHIAAGVAALVAGLGALVTTKGGRRHRQAGRVFLGSLGITLGTVFLLLFFDPTSFRIFLTLVAVCSGYLAFSGYRSLSRKRPAGEPNRIDWASAGLVVIVCFGLSGWGLRQLVVGEVFGLVMLVFGLIGLAFGTFDLRTFRSQTWDGDWMVTHLQRMIGAFIATVSAVSAVNLTSSLGVIAWLWPTAVGIPLIVYWSNKYSTS